LRVETTQVATRWRAINAGGVDWAANWRRKVEVRQAHPVGMRDWDGRAQRFARRAAELNSARDPLLRVLAEGVSKDDSALDVGAGAGRYALPLASLAGRVTAVEPSPGMRAALAGALAERGVESVSVVAGTWQEAVVEPHDVVMCAHVLYFVADVVPFIEKLDTAARRACYIYIRVEGREEPLLPLWEELAGGPFPSEPGFADLYPLLLSLGIRANVRLTPPEGGGGYPDLDEALGQARLQLGLTLDQHEHDGRIREFLREHLVERNGRLSFPTRMQSAVVWWQKE